MKKTLAIVGTAAAIATGGYLAFQSSVTPAPQPVTPAPRPVKIKFGYFDIDAAPYITVCLQRSTNLQNWITLNVWSNLSLVDTNNLRNLKIAPYVITNFAYTDVNIFPNQSYRTGTAWTNEQIRPPGY